MIALIIQANNGKRMVIFLEMVDFRWLEKNNVQKIDYFSLAIELFWQITSKNRLFSEITSFNFKKLHTVLSQWLRNYLHNAKNIFPWLDSNPRPLVKEEGALTVSATLLRYWNYLGFCFIIHADFPWLATSRKSFDYTTFEFCKVMTANSTFYHISEVV